TNNAGLLTMTNPADQLTINGNADFDGADMGNSTLTAGLLIVKGNFTTHNAHTQGYRSAGTHITRLAGTSAQTISIYYPADAQQRIQNLEFQNAAGVTFGSPVDAVNVSVLGTTPVGGLQTLFVTGAVTAAASTNLSGMAGVTVYGGSTLPAMLGAPPPVVTIDGTAVTMTTGPITVGGNLTLTNSGALTLNGQQLTVGGNFATTNNAGLLTMTNPADQLTINGNADFDGADMGNSTLTAGLLIVKGNFTTHNAHTQGYRSAGTHITRLAGTSTQLINIYYPLDNQQRIQNLQFQNAVGVTFQTNVSVVNASISTGTSLSGASSGLYSVGAVTSTAGTSLAGLGFVVVYGGTTMPAFAGTPPPVTYLDAALGAAITMTAPVTFSSGDLVVTNSATLTLNGQALTLNGNFYTANNGNLLMTNPADLFTISGFADWDGADMGASSLTAGLLIVNGNFVTHNSHTQSFSAFGTHTTRFAGSGPQVVSFYYPSPAQHHFANVQVAAGSTLSITASNVDVLGNLVQSGVLNVSSPFILNITGNLSLNSASNTTVTGSLLKGSCTPAGGTFIGFTCP
ncbi:MAG: hypothetical protein ACHQQ3_06750, partial [Gemmatimonadales bacterium]